MLNVCCVCEYSCKIDFYYCIFQLFFTFDNGSIPLAMSYDWIAKKLYVSVNNERWLNIYYLLDVGNIEDRDMIHVYASDRELSSSLTEMTVNPFEG